LSVVGVAHDSPPSSASGQSLYGPANTSATLTTAAAFALASTAYNSAGLVAYADELEQKAIAAWDWAVDNPDVIFKNNDAEFNSQGLAAGQQEVDDYGRLTKKIMAACFLFELTGDAVYRSFFDDNYDQVNMIEWNHAFPFQTANQDMLLYYTSLEETTPTVVQHIKTVYGNSMMNGDENYPAITGQKDPYMAHVKDYVWGSNSVKCLKGNMFMNVARFDAGTINMDEVKSIAVKYINYLHGVNPLNFVYLSNMFSHGAEQGVREFYHTWFANGSFLWDRVGESTYGPAPGFLTGGPNPSYDWDGCCPGGCGSAANNQACNSVDIFPPKDQPVQKSYKDFNNSWPLNSWSVTENSCGYQMNYIRLLANFADYSYDCNGDLNGEASIDVCGECAGGNTGREPVVDTADCETNAIMLPESDRQGFSLWPNPVRNDLFVNNSFGKEFTYSIVSLKGIVLQEGLGRGTETIDVSSLDPGTYFFVFDIDTGGFSQKVVVN
jgi:endoglucanase